MDASQLQLPTMPTSLGVNQNPAAPAAPSLMSNVGKFLTQPFTGNVPQPAAAAAPAIPVGPQTQTQSRDVLHPAQVNYGGGWVADPAAIARGPSYLDTLPTMAPPTAAPVDPLAGQIHFIDKNSPHAAAPQAAPNIVRGGEMSAAPQGGGGLNIRQASMLMPLLVPQASPQTRGMHSLMNIYEKQLGTESADPNLKPGVALHNYELRMINLIKGLPGITGDTAAHDAMNQ